MYKTIVLCCVQFPTPLQFGACDQSYESGVTGGEERRSGKGGEDVRRVMAAPAGTTIRQKGSISKPSGALSSDAFDFSRMQDQLEVPCRVVPRWFGHSLSLPPDSGIGLGATERTGEQG